MCELLLICWFEELHRPSTQMNTRVGGVLGGNHWLPCFSRKPSTFLSLISIHIGWWIRNNYYHLRFWWTRSFLVTVKVSKLVLYQIKHTGISPCWLVIHNVIGPTGVVLDGCELSSRGASDAHWLVPVAVSSIDSLSSTL